MKCVVFLMALMLSSFTVQAELIVVEDRGGAPAQSYYEALGVSSEPVSQPAVSPQVMPADESFALPVRSGDLTPGRVAPGRLSAPGLQPFFLIGDDDLSREWMEERREILRKIGAFGLVVNVESREGLEQLRNLVPDLTLSPVSGDDLAQRLRLSHYPVLITSTGIEQ